MDFLDTILAAVGGKTTTDSTGKPLTGQLDRLKAQQAAHKATPESERAAKAAGFPNAEAYRLWLQQRKVQGPGSVAGKGKAATQPSVDAATSWHPANIFNAISEALRNATGGGN